LGGRLDLAPDVGDFLGLLANRHSKAIADRLLTLAAAYVPGLPVLALETDLGVERYLGDLGRSDHIPFWEAGFASVLWTDTADFRNPHYTAQATRRRASITHSSPGHETGAGTGGGAGAGDGDIAERFLLEARGLARISSH
jgi:hypothetical protein